MKQSLVLFFMLVMLTAWATEQLDFTPVKVRKPSDGLMYWALAEAYRDYHPGFIREKILPQSQFKNPQVLACFPNDLYQGDTADSSLMVLLHALNWENCTKTPILLVHGAADDAFRGWVHPMTMTTPDTIEYPGFMQKFSKAGYPVFAINFSHHHGCNYRQAEQIRNAIQIIKHKTGARKIHLLAHSKGNCAASIYVCGGNTVNPNYKDFLSPFGQDVDVYIQVAAGNKGVDTMFRYYTSNLTVLSLKASAPVCVKEALVYGVWQKYYKEDIYKTNLGPEVGNYFPGQSQLLYNLVEDGLDFTAFCYTPADANLTMKACYYGGTTLFVSSYGIQHAIAEGDYTIERINKAGLDPSVRLLNIYGTNPVFIEIDMIFYKIPISVPDYPSDGAVYVHSASYIDGLLSRGASLLGQKAFDKNHVVLAFSDDTFAWIIEQLNK